MKSSNLMKAIVASAFVLGVSTISTPAMAHAQKIEVAAGGGWAHYSNNGYSVDKGKFGASVSYNIFSNLAIGFEYGFSPLYSESGEGYSETEHLYNYGAVARFGLTHATKMQPYVLFAAGGARDTDKYTETEEEGEFRPAAITVTGTDSESGGYFGLGGGLNASLGHGFGVRPEFRYQRIMINDAHLNEVNLTGSVYYRF